MDYKVYAIQSEKNSRIYVGFSEDLDRRIREHNSGKTKSTKGFRLWNLIFQQSYASRTEARKLEKYHKSGVDKEKLKQMVP